MSKDKQVLGKGLDILFGNTEPESIEPRPEETTEQPPEKEESILFLEVEKIKTNPYQPREEFEEEALQELADSIKQKGVIQAITVRKVDDGYELLSGERRLRASKMAGLERIPAFILDVTSPEDLLEISLIENIQRKDLNALEVAQGYQRLIDECNLRQEDVAERVGKSRSAITNYLRLLKLPEEIKQSIRKGEISEGHARSILAAENAEEQIVLWKRIVSDNLSVRKTEELTKKTKKEPKEKKIFQVTNQDKAAIDFLETKFREHFGTKVKIHPKSKTSGDIIIEYYTSEDLERIIELCKK
ncbi:MAG: ParB/RepB/Spo0J family partition protein [Ignavibacteriae bacterium]|nr:MAG: ParB/RepB/Spo0J family partition protein [Ignavibacteriota bacterium]